MSQTHQCSIICRLSDDPFNTIPVKTYILLHCCTWKAVQGLIDVVLQGFRRHILTISPIYGRYPWAVLQTSAVESMIR